MNTKSQKYKSPEDAIISNIKLILSSIGEKIRHSVSSTSKIRELPSFTKASEYLPEITLELQRTFLRMCNRSAEKMNAYQQNILAKVSRYGIECQVQKSDLDYWEGVANSVYHWEALLEKAKKQKLEWCESYN